MHKRGRRYGGLLAVLAVTLMIVSSPADARTSCRSYRVGSTTYSKCDDGKPSTPPVSCRTYKVGSATYSTKCK